MQGSLRWCLYRSEAAPRKHWEEDPIVPIARYFNGLSRRIECSFTNKVCNPLSFDIFPPPLQPSLAFYNPLEPSTNPQ